MRLSTAILCLATACTWSAEAPHPLLASYAALSALGPLEVVSEQPATVGALTLNRRYTFLADGPAWRIDISTPGGQPGGPAADTQGPIYAFDGTRFQHYRPGRGELSLRSYPSPSAATGRSLQAQAPRWMRPLEPLTWEDGVCVEGLFAWPQLRDPALVAAGLDRLHATAAADGGASILTIPVRSYAATPEGGVAPTDKGLQQLWRIRPQASAGGLALVDEIGYAQGGRRLAARTTLTWSIPAGAPTGAALPDRIVYTDAAGAQTVESRLISAVVGRAIAPARFQIDPTLAKVVLDEDSGMTIEPGAR